MKKEKKGKGKGKTQKKPFNTQIALKKQFYLTEAEAALNQMENEIRKGTLV